MFSRYFLIICYSFISFSVLTSVAYSQENFVPIEDGDYKIVQKPLTIIPNVNLSGSFIVSYLLSAEKLFGKNKHNNKRAHKPNRFDEATLPEHKEVIEDEPSTEVYEN